MKLSTKFFSFLIQILTFISLSPVLGLTQVPDNTFSSENQTFSWKTIIKDPDVIWGMDFLSPEELIYSTKQGKIKIVNLTSKTIKSLAGVPEINILGQGGLLDLRYHPESKYLYFTYAKKNLFGKHTTVLGRGKIKDSELFNHENLLIADAYSTHGEHFGSRIEFQDQYLFFSIGDRGLRDEAQNLALHNGKILRLTLNGKVPKDNPFQKDSFAKAEIWSYGHRNPQGLALNPVTKELWEAEFGPQGGDEINLISAGKNYGWPKITYGEEYGGGKISETSALGMEQPIKYWVPSISPSGISFYNHDRIPNWKGNLFMSTLSGQHLRRLVIKDNKVIREESLLHNLGIRFRCIRIAPDGRLFVSTDDGQIIIIANLNS